MSKLPHQDRFIIKDRLNPNNDEIQVSYVYVAEEFVLNFGQEPSAEQLKDFQKRYDIKAITKLSTANTYKISTNKVILARYKQVYKEVQSDSLVCFVEGNSLRYTTKLPNNLMYNQLWGFDNSGVDNVQGGRGGIALVENSDIQADKAW